MDDKKCKCGCGATSNYGYWVFGHWNRGLIRSVETRIKIGKAGKGRVHSPETKSKMSISRMGHIISMETRMKISKSLMGHPCSVETRKKIGEIHKGKVISPENIEKLRQSAISRERKKGGKLSEEHKLKIRESLKKSWKNRKWSPEQISKMRERARKQHEDGRVGTAWFNTSIERKVKDYLQTLNVNFKHQKIIKTEMGNILVDFLIEPNIVIECDGDYWHNYPKGKDIDFVKTQFMKKAGYIVLRFWEHTINRNFDEVKESIYSRILFLESDNEISKSNYFREIDELNKREDIWKILG